MLMLSDSVPNMETTPENQKLSDQSSLDDQPSLGEQPSQSDWPMRTYTVTVYEDPANTVDYEAVLEAVLDAADPTSTNLVSAATRLEKD
jgi:hypothetical protein